MIEELLKELESEETITQEIEKLENDFSDMEVIYEDLQV